MLRRDIDRLADRERRAQSLAQRVALQKFSDRVRRSVREGEVEDRENVRMRQRRNSFRFPLESPASIRIGRDACWQYLDRDVPAEPRVASPIHVAHASGANDAQDFVRTKSSARFQDQCFRYRRSVFLRRTKERAVKTVDGCQRTVYRDPDMLPMAAIMLIVELYWLVSIDDVAW